MKNTDVSILIVEDEVLIAMKMRRNLELDGYNVYEPVVSGGEAITMATELQPDIIFMDIRLPGGMDGIEAAREIRGQYGTPIIFMTGYSDQETFDRAQQVGPAAFLEKPVFPQELKAAIVAALEQSR